MAADKDLPAVATRADMACAHDGAQEAHMAKARSTKQRSFDLVDHFDQEAHPVDAAVGRHPKVRALRERVRQATKPFEKALGARRLELWLPLEEALLELAGTREELMFDQGHAHGYAAGRAEGMVSTAEAGALAAVLRDVALQAGCQREMVVAALLEAAWALATKRTPRTARRSPR